jgi:hypothetical protein
VTLTTEEKTRTSGCGLTSNAQADRITTTQLGVIASIRKGDGFLVVVYPRMREQPRPLIVPIAGGHGVKVVTPGATDWVFLSSTKLSYRDEAVRFDGMVGAVQMRGRRIRANLGAAGKLAVAGHLIESDQPAADEWCLQ